ncbi:MAG: sugar phosphate isomerase/epimerase [Chloroflexi bacterium]|nr:sugar phosphate isomerase/epimerase [Chloroflexota bacterium]
MMKLGFSAWAMRERPVDEQIAIVRDAGYASICLVSGPTFSLDAMQAGTAERQRIRRLLDEAGLELSAVAGHANLLEPDEVQRAANVDRVKATLDLAADLAGPSGPPPVICMGYGKPERYEDERHRLALAFGELARHAAAQDGVLALEPHVGQMMDAPEKVIWLMEAVNSPHFRLNLDNSHFEVMGRDLDDYLPLLIPYSVHTDLKDQRGRFPDHEFLVPGEGDFDYARYLRAMDRAGYTGCITVEISVMVQRRPSYDPAEVARRSFATLVAAEQAAGVPLARQNGRIRSSRPASTGGSA